MIKRLFYKDVKDITKVLKYMCLACLSLAVIARLFKLGDHIGVLNILAIVFQNTLYAGIVNVLVNAIISIIRVFVVDFYKDQSYLTHTLPVSKATLLSAKYLASFSVLIGSILVSLISLLICFVSKDLFSIIGNFLSETAPGLDISLGIFLALIVILIILQILSYTAMGFTAIIKGHQSNRKKAGKSVLWFLLFYFASMIFILLIAVVVFAINGNLNALFLETIPANYLLSIIVCAIIADIILTTLFIFLSIKEFNKGVNVD